MEDLTAAYVTLGAGVALLVLVVLAVAGPLRRFARANAAFRADLERRTSRIRALMTVRRHGDRRTRTA